MHSGSAVFATLFLASAGAALAQTGAASVSVPQLSFPERAGVVATSQADTSAVARSRSEREALVSAGAPIGEGRRTAEASPALSTRAEGRAVHAAPVGGHDRCDAPGEAETRLCRDRLEARAGEYQKPGAAPVTAEGRLLVLTDPQPGSLTMNEAARRLGGAPGLDSLAGGAASELAGAISSTRGDTSQAGPANTGAAATALPAGVPAVVLTPH